MLMYMSKKYVVCYGNYCLFSFFLQDFVSASVSNFVLCSVLHNVLLGVVGVEGSNFIVVKVKRVSIFVGDFKLQFFFFFF
jgi:hypothetical protein